MTTQDYKSEKERKLLEMVAAKPGTDITDLARQFLQIREEQEGVLEDRFNQQQTVRPELSDGDLEEIRSRNLETVVGLYSGTKEITPKHLSLVPAFVFYGERIIAKRILENVLSSDRFDESKWVIFHGRQYQYGDLGDDFVGLDDQIALTRAFFSLGRPDKAQRTMDCTRELMLVKEAASPNYLNVREYANANTGKMAKCDAWKLRNPPHKDIAEYLQGELIIGEITGDKSSVRQLLRGEWMKYHYNQFRYLGLVASRKYLGLCRTLGMPEQSSLVQPSENVLEGCYVPEWNLYARYPWAWYRSVGDRRLPPINELSSYSQLNVAFLHLLDGERNKAKALLTATLNAGLYKDERFTDNDPKTDALGLFVLQGIKDPERVKEFVYV